MALKSKKHNQQNNSNSYQHHDKDAFVLPDGTEPQSLDDVLKILEDRYAAQMMRQVGLISSDKEKKKQNPSSASLPKLRVARPSLDNLLSLASAAAAGKTSERGSFEELVTGTKKKKKSSKDKESGKKSSGKESSGGIRGSSTSSSPSGVNQDADASGNEVNLNRMTPLKLAPAPTPILGSIPENESLAVDKVPVDLNAYAPPSFGSETAMDFFAALSWDGGAAAAGAGGEGSGSGVAATVPVAGEELGSVYSAQATLSALSKEAEVVRLPAQANADERSAVYDQQYHAQPQSYDYASYMPSSAEERNGAYDLFMSYPYPDGAPIP